MARRRNRITDPNTTVNTDAESADPVATDAEVDTQDVSVPGVEPETPTAETPADSSTPETLPAAPEAPPSAPAPEVVEAAPAENKLSRKAERMIRFWLARYVPLERLNAEARKAIDGVQAGRVVILTRKPFTVDVLEAAFSKETLEAVTAAAASRPVMCLNQRLVEINELSA